MIDKPYSVISIIDYETSSKTVKVSKFICFTYNRAIKQSCNQFKKNRGLHVHVDVLQDCTETSLEHLFEETIIDYTWYIFLYFAKNIFLSQTF